MFTPAIPETLILVSMSATQSCTLMMTDRPTGPGHIAGDTPGCAEGDGQNSCSTSDAPGPGDSSGWCPTCGCSLPGAARGSPRCSCELEGGSGDGSGRDRCRASSTAASVYGSGSGSGSEDACSDGSCSRGGASCASCCDGEISARSSSSSSSSNGSGGSGASSIDADVVEAAHRTLARRAAKASRPQQTAAEEDSGQSGVSPAPRRAWGIANRASACRRCAELQDQLQVAILWIPCQP